MEHPLNLTSFLPAHIQETYLPVIMLVIAVLIIFFMGLYVRTLRSEVPSKSQNAFEWLVGGLNNLGIDVMGKEGAAYMPIILGIGLYVGVSNLMSLIPGLVPPTSNMNTTAAPALLVFVLYNFIGIKKHGAKYIKHFLGPTEGAMVLLAPFMFVIEVISHLARPLSLTMRLFGNIAGEDLVVVILFMLVPFLLPIPMFFLMIFTSILQAFVFMMLAMVYIAGALEEAH